jgi:hypothetical protein
MFTQMFAVTTATSWVVARVNKEQNAFALSFFISGN